MVAWEPQPLSTLAAQAARGQLGPHGAMASDPYPLAVVLEALVVLLDELLVAGGELFLDGAIDRVAVLVAEVAPGALRAAAVQPLDRVAVGPLAAAAGVAALAALALGLAFAFAWLAAWLLALARAAALAVALALFGFLDQLGQDLDDLVLLLAGFVPVSSSDSLRRLKSIRSCTSLSVPSWKSLSCSSWRNAPTRIRSGASG